MECSDPVICMNFLLIAVTNLTTVISRLESTIQDIDNRVSTFGSTHGSAIVTILVFILLALFLYIAQWVADVGRKAVVVASQRLRLTNLQDDDSDEPLEP